ncbi:cytochrome c oxidase assembly protein [Aurantimonas endophytica]|uniref:Putative membrane protein n=1 Tax=Aurantimonas endophytica TaxID=1522175 RepID=A0A7W6MPL4_9HYPH|nr:cytochrome c oxidase assembly protein [Aurantimonas endophytica]MBB4003120.1 putative membrane protein [Aurantimonas endophytica]MCO6403992.1 cytochrome c oxidase assembly protein [Aurantimonas endophytica]
MTPLTTPEAFDPYCGAPPPPGELLAAWNGDPVLIASLALATIAGFWVLRGDGRGRARLWHAGAMLMLVAAFLSPLCALSSALFSARVVHHLLLIAVAAPMLALAFPKRRAGGTALLSLLVAVHLVAVWFWHAPQPYETALSSDTIYWTMELTLLVSGVLLWRELTAPAAPVGRILMAHLTLIVQMGLLGALITFAPEPLYAPHFLTTTPYGLSALDDQQLAGLIMWVPAIAPYLLAALLALDSLIRDGFGQKGQAV